MVVQSPSSYLIHFNFRWVKLLWIVSFRVFNFVDDRFFIFTSMVGRLELHLWISCLSQCRHLIYIREHLDCVLKSGNSDNPYTVAVMKAGEIYNWSWAADHLIVSVHSLCSWHRKAIICTGTVLIHQFTFLSLTLGTHVQQGYSSWLCLCVRLWITFVWQKIQLKRAFFRKTASLQNYRVCIKVIIAHAQLSAILLPSRQAYFNHMLLLSTMWS